MKTKIKAIITAVIVLVSINLFSQESIKSDTISKNLCIERGHVFSESIMITDIYCPSYLVENDTISYIVKPSCNYVTKCCLRCAAIIEEKEKEQRIVVWRKSDE